MWTAAALSDWTSGGQGQSYMGCRAFVDQAYCEALLATSAPFGDESNIVTIERVFPG